uniref:Testin n=1 Tax=Lepeophtheirus salmonis TaxID=72036 RepID=A0A0K2TJ45_LEPSM
MSEAENGFMQPNPALFDLEERRKKKNSLAHELGEGSSCRICLGKCPGFQLHYWRKVCSNCRCGKAEHDVRDSEIDPGCYFVGKIFDRPLRSLKEELEFCYGRFSPNEELKRGSRLNGNDSGNESIKTDDEDDEAKRRLKGGNGVPNKKVTLDWVPPNVSGSRTLITKYLKSLPYVPISGSSGAIQRRQQLQKQFPVHDIEPDKCHNLTAGEIDSMANYLLHVKENNVGQGMVLEIPDEDFPPPPPPLENLCISDEAPDYLPPPPPSLLEDSDNSNPLDTTPGISPGEAPKKDDINQVSSPLKKLSKCPIIPPKNGNLGEYLNTDFPVHQSKGKESSPLVKDDSPSNLPLIVKGKCDGCKMVFLPGDVVIRAERATDGQLWHPSCFKCSACKELLVDLLYYYDEGKLYCGRDFAVIVSKIPRCAACDELIFATEYTGAEEKVFHLRHFCCYECDRPLAGHKYISVESQPHCFICYQAKHGKVCKTCNEYINPGDQRLSLDTDHWHATHECFCCGVCGKSLVGEKMTRKDGYILCSSICRVKLIESMVKRGVVV